MKKLVLAILAAGFAFAAPAYAAPPPFDSAEGAGTFVFFNGAEKQFTLSAKQQGFGPHATGTYTQQNLDGTRRFVGRVTCLNALGNTAAVAGFVTEAASAALVGTPFAVWVVDNGPPGSSPPDMISALNVFSPEEIAASGFSPAFPLICPSPVGPAIFPLDSGNIVVDDESPPGAPPTP